MRFRISGGILRRQYLGVRRAITCLAKLVNGTRAGAISWLFEDADTFCCRSMTEVVSWVEEAILPSLL